MIGRQRYRHSRALYERAHEIIPGATHVVGRPMLGPDNSPLYFQRGQGGRIWDVDGNEYIDLVMAKGPVLLGYANPEVDKAALAQAAGGVLLSLNHPLHLHFMETLLDRFPAANMGLFFKTGSEATTAAVRIARRATGRRSIARCGYHGWHDWCWPGEDYVPEGLEEQVLGYDAMHPATLSALLDANPGRFAAVILAAEALFPPSSQKLTALMNAARQHGALFILDEVKTAFRSPGGSIQAFCNVAPDITTVSKALGNGWPIAAVIGSKAAMAHASGIPLSATYHGELASMAAAIATMHIIDREDVQPLVWKLGQRLIDGINSAAKRNHFPAEAYGAPIPPMPFLRFTDPDPVRNNRLRSLLYAHVISEGILLNPWHMWFVAAAHTRADIEKVVDIVDAAMNSVMQTDGGFEEPARLQASA